ncbi:hypothetical protein J4210_03280 [Candidatus Woesearchaeota archaeon]|nr:hypothetical protein [Candidatus Woesearchaeota archaeon]
MAKKQTQKPKNLERSVFFQHCLRYQKIYLLLLFLLLSSFIFFNNAQDGKPLLADAESYYHLAEAKSLSVRNFHYAPLAFLEEQGGMLSLVFLALILAILTLFNIWTIFRKLNFSATHTFIFSLILILTPAFMRSATSLSSALLYLFLLSLSFVLFFHCQQKIRYLAVFPSLAIACLDQFSVLLTLIIFALSALNSERNSRRLIWISSGVLLLAAGATTFIFDISFLSGPFHTSQLARDLISDFGSFSGMSFFVFVLGLLGLVISWPRKVSYFLLYLVLPLLVPAYVYNPEALFPLSIIFIFFATRTILTFLRHQWQLPILQRFTVFLLFLGILFSSLSYISQIESAGLQRDDLEVLHWMKEYLPDEAIVASFPEDADYLRYFAGKEIFFAYHFQDPEKENNNSLILDAEYVQQLFPLLEKNGIGYLYISTSAAEQLPRERGLFFLFQNERFKLLYSSGESGVWKFDLSASEGG